MGLHWSAGFLHSDPLLRSCLEASFHCGLVLPSQNHLGNGLSTSADPSSVPYIFPFPPSLLLLLLLLSL